MDVMTKEQRHKNMSHIRDRDTKLEVLVRSALFRAGFRFRKNDSRYPGKPDVVLPKYKTVIFVNGCFWHHHEGCKLAYVPKSRVDFWMKKFHQNQVNDKFQKEELERMGWHVITIWECELKKDFDGVITRLIEVLRSRQDQN